jgi:internalin A
MAKNEAYQQAEQKIQQALKSGATELDLRNMKLTELPESIGQLKQLRKLDVGGDSWKDEKNQLTTLPDSLALAQLMQLTSLDLSNNQLTTLPPSLALAQLTQLTSLNLSSNQLTTLPPSLGQLTQLTELDLSRNQLTTLPDSLGQLTQLQTLNLSNNQLTALPESLGQLAQLQSLNLSRNQLVALPEYVGHLKQLQDIWLNDNKFASLPESLGLLENLNRLMLSNGEEGIPLGNLPDWISRLENLEHLWAQSCNLKNLPEWIGELSKLEDLVVQDNEITELPSSMQQLKHINHLAIDTNHIVDLPIWLVKFEKLKHFSIGNNPLNPALQSAYDQSLDAVKAYLRSLEQNAEPLYEAKLVLVGEGGVGKTTLLNALMNKEERTPKKDETTTHGVKIDVNALQVPHPAFGKEGVKIQLNAWDFGGQEVYRVTHQFFFSRRSLYLLVWEPRRGVQQCQVEDWLNMIRLRVGDEARVIIVSTNSKSGGHIARIDQPVFKQQYGEMIVGFHEVDSLVSDESTGEMVGIAKLKKIIAEESTKFNHVGMLFNNDWKAARDELIARPEAHIRYSTFTEVCASHKLSEIDTKTLAGIMHDLGYIVHYSEDEKLRDDIVLKPEWLTKAIGFVLEDRATAESEGILPDKHLYEVWHNHQFKDEPRYTPDLYPFFLRLMEKYDVCYRLPDDRKASLVAQHVPQVRPELPWLPEQNPPTDQRRIAMVCAMEEDPPGLVPWMIVRTHDYSVEQGKHHLHWQKGMFLNHGTHGTAMVEKRDREFHIYAQAAWPAHFMNVLHSTLEKLISDNWPGLEGRYRFMVPCPEIVDDEPCKGRFNIHALRQFLAEGDSSVRCQECSKRLSIAELLLGFEERDMNTQLREIQEQLAQAQKQIAGLDSRIADYFWATMQAIADEAKSGPRLFTFRSRDAGLSPKQLFTRPISLQLWCEAEGCQHPIIEDGKGLYSIDQPHDWVMKIAPYANFALDILKTVAPIAAPGINTFFGPKTTELWGIADHLSLASAIISKLPEEVKTPDKPMLQRGMVSEPERSGILALHRLLNELDPTQNKLGLHRVATYTGDYRWLCKRHYDAYQPNIPDVINGK